MKRPLFLLVSAALIVGCGGGGDDDDGPQEPAAETATFESDEIAFTFEYPRELEARTRPDGPVLGQVAIERDAVINGIKVRRTADRELERERYLDEFERDFERTVGDVEQREERVGDLDLGVLEFEDSAPLEGEQTTFTSTSYFFAGGGDTWQVECIADEQHRDRIEDACRTALESVEFPDDE